MKKVFSLLLAAALLGTFACNTGLSSEPVTNDSDSTAVATVYFTSDISSEGLVRIYEALGVPATGRVAVKISTGESSKSNYLRPELIEGLVKKVNGTLVECNTAYGGNRMSTANHRKAIAERGFDKIAKVDIMDEEGSKQIPVSDTKHLKYDIVGTHIDNYDFMINLAHFKGHAMGGFGGVLKNQSIGVASTAGKYYIHSAGASSTSWTGAAQDDFLESMAAAAQGVHNYFKRDGKNIIYIDVMNNMSVDCDCDGNPAQPRLKDIGILASTDPVAVDQACLDLVFNHSDATGDDAKPLQQRINRQHGTYITEYAESIGLGTRNYKIINIDSTMSKSNILVVYFSHAGENYSVGNIKVGNTKLVADEIAALSGADEFEIVAGKNYDMPYSELIQVAQQESRSNELPSYEGGVENMAQYDTVFVGGPIWWGTYPQVMFSFFEDYDLNGKTVIPFTTHEGSGLGSVVEDLKAQYPGAKITSPFSIAGHDVRSGKDRIDSWVRGVLK